MTNQNVRIELLTSGIKQWELADKLGISEFTLCRKLRSELSEEEEARIMKAIDEIKAGRNGDAKNKTDNEIQRAKVSSD